MPVNEVHEERGSSPTEAGVANRAILTGANRAAQREAVSGVEEPILTIGGDCGVELEPIRAVRERYGAGLGVAWFYAHPDLKTPQTAHDGAYHAMVLAGLMGQEDPELIVTVPVDPSKVTLVDARASVAAELAAIERGMGIQTDDPAAVLSDASHVYVHSDLDVLDPSQFDGHNMPEPDALTIPQLVASLESLSRFNVVGAGITECVVTAQQVDVLSPIIAKVAELLRVTTS